MGQPKVSIIVPTYNVEPYLRECLDSICRQTLKDIEIICVNDGSTDGSLAIINEYATRDSRIVVLDGPNGGYGKGMNRGLDRATGEYIGIVEPDDFIALTMYEDLYAIASEHDLDFVKADFYRFTREENGDMELKYNHLDKTDTWYNKVFDPSQEPEALRFIMNTWSGIYRREFLEERGIRHHETPGASFQDNGFWMQTFVYGRRAMIVNRPYYRNRRDNPNSSVKDTGKVYCMNVEYDYIEDLLRKDTDVWERFKAMFWLKRFGNYTFTLSRIDSSFIPEYCERIREDFLRARDAGELDQAVFSEKQWNDLQAIFANPQAFAKRYIARRNKKARRKEAIESARVWARKVLK